MPERACTNCGQPTSPGPRCPDCTITRGPQSKRRRIRAAVIRRDGLTCAICHLAVEPADLHIDHTIPLADGGPDTLTNQRVTHAKCNLRKGRHA
jgi:5-methylcytosine-specific restriction endonuclease McrA